MIREAHAAQGEGCPWQFSLLRGGGAKENAKTVLCVSLPSVAPRTSVWRPKPTTSDAEIAESVIVRRVRRQKLLKVVLVDEDWTSPGLRSPGKVADEGAGDTDGQGDEGPHGAAVFLVAPKAAREMFTAMAVHALTPGTGPVSPVLQHVINGFCPETPRPFAKPWHDTVHENAWMNFICPNPGRIARSYEALAAPRPAKQGRNVGKGKRRKREAAGEEEWKGNAIFDVSSPPLRRVLREPENEEFSKVPVELEGAQGKGEPEGHASFSHCESDFFASDDESFGGFPDGAPRNGGAGGDLADAPCAAFLQIVSRSDAPPTPPAKGEAGRVPETAAPVAEEKSEEGKKERKRRRGNRGICGPACSCSACYESASAEGLSFGGNPWLVEKDERAEPGRGFGDDEYAWAAPRAAGKGKRREGEKREKFWNPFHDRFGTDKQGAIAASCTAFAFAVRVACVSPKNCFAAKRLVRDEGKTAHPSYAWGDQHNVRAVLLDNLRSKMRVDAPYQVPVAAAALVFDAAMYFSDPAVAAAGKNTPAHLHALAERIRETPSFEAAGTTCGQLAAMVRGVSSVYVAVRCAGSAEVAAENAGHAAGEAGFDVSACTLAKRCASLFWPAHAVLSSWHTRQSVSDARTLSHLVPVQRVAASRVRFLAQRYRMMGSAERANGFCARYGAGALVGFEFLAAASTPLPKDPEVVVYRQRLERVGEATKPRALPLGGLHAIPSPLELVSYVRAAAPFARDGRDFFIVRAPGAQKAWKDGNAIAMLCTPHLGEVLCLGQVLVTCARFSLQGNGDLRSLQGFWHDLFLQSGGGGGDSETKGKKADRRSGNGRRSVVSAQVPHVVLRPALALAAALHKYAGQSGENGKRNGHLLSCMLHALWLLLGGQERPCCAGNSAYEDGPGAERVFAVLNALVDSVPRTLEGQGALLDACSGLALEEGFPLRLRRAISFALQPPCSCVCVKRKKRALSPLPKQTDAVAERLRDAFPKARRDPETGRVLAGNWRDRWHFLRDAASLCGDRETESSGHGNGFSSFLADVSRAEDDPAGLQVHAVSGGALSPERASRVRLACGGCARLAECVAVARRESEGGVGNEGGVATLLEAFPTLFAGSLMSFGAQTAVFGTEPSAGSLSGARVAEREEIFFGNTPKHPELPPSLPRPMCDVAPGLIESALVNFWPAS